MPASHDNTVCLPLLGQRLVARLCREPALKRPPCRTPKPGGRIRWIAAAVVALSLSSGPGCHRRASSAQDPKAPLAGQSVLLITLDTTRADRLGCQGYKDGVTPTLDRLGGEGCLFERAYAQVPLTFPSHASMMTGKYPREFGVRINGRHGLGPEHTTLAELAKAAGYRTGAFVAAFVLASRFGLNQGFEVYEDETHLEPGETDALEAQVRANVVTDRALAWLKSSAKEPFFCWVHYYDAHDPYDPPPEFRAKVADRYDGELAFVDSQVARLLDELVAKGCRDRTLIVVVGDHGESLGEHDEHGHGTFLYDTTLHVPFFFAHKGLIPKPLRVGTPVEIVDVFPTLCGLMGWAMPSEVTSRSLEDALAGGSIDGLPCYAESHHAFEGHGWAEQRSLRMEPWKYISSTKPELYDVAADPGETKNLLDGHSAEAQRLKDELVRRYEAMTEGTGQGVMMDAAARGALEALGYVSGGASRPPQLLTPGLPDPKDMKDVVRSQTRARRLISQGRHGEAAQLLRGAAEKSPGSRQLNYLLGTSLMFSGDTSGALVYLKRALEIQPGDASILVAMANALFAERRVDEAAQHCEAALKIEQNPEAMATLARIASSQGKPDEAIKQLRQALEISPTSVDAAASLTALYNQINEPQEATRFFTSLASRHRDVAVAQYNAGAAILNGGDPVKAEVALREALRLNPDLGPAYNKLGICLAMQGNVPRARAAFERAVTFVEAKAEGHYNLGVSYEKEGAIERAIEEYRQAILAKPAYPGAIVALARQLLRRGQTAEAVRVLRGGAEHCPSEVPILNTLADLLATSPDAAIRDGASAMHYAEQAVKLVEPVHPGLLATLAAAQAETGELERALQTATRALDLARSGGLPAEQIAKIESQLQSYKSGKPYRTSGL